MKKHFDTKSKDFKVKGSYGNTKDTKSSVSSVYKGKILFVNFNSYIRRISKQRHEEDCWL